MICHWFSNVVHILISSFSSKSVLFSVLLFLYLFPSFVVNFFVFSFCDLPSLGWIYFILLYLYFCYLLFLICVWPEERWWNTYSQIFQFSSSSISSILSFSTLFHSIQFNSMLCYSFLFYSFLFHFYLLHSVIFSSLLFFKFMI